MNKSVIIKLRQAEAVLNDYSENGTYSITLSQPISMQQGDVISIKSAFIDTTTETLVSVPEAITLEIELAKYLTNYYNSAETPLINNPFQLAHMAYSENSIPSGAPEDPSKFPLQYPDLKRYWCCKPVLGKGQMKMIDFLTVRSDRVRGKYGDNCVFQIRTLSTDQTTAGATQVLNISMGTSDGRVSKAGLTYQVKVGQLCGFNAEGSPEIVILPFAQPDVTFGAFHVLTPTANDFILSDALAEGRQAALATETIKIPLAVGEYLPGELAQIITDNMSELSNAQGEVGIDYSKGLFLSNSPFLSSTYQMYYKNFKPASTIGSETDETMLWIPESDSSAKPIQPITGIFSQWWHPTSAADDNFCGTNNASLNYDPILQKLNFDVLHFPPFVAAGGSIFVPGVVYPPTSLRTGAGAPDAPHNAIQTYSGIGITNLEPQLFWRNLGFNSSNFVDWSHSSTATVYWGGSYKTNAAGTLANLAPATGRGLYPLEIKSQNGISTTAQYAGIDLIVPKTATWMVPTANATGIESSTTIPIIADRQFNASLVDDGFYLVNIGIKFPQKMIGSANEGATRGDPSSNTLQSIVGKYFTQGNFLQDQGSGSITYTHVGEPQIITELSVKITNGDGSTPAKQDIGPNSSIFVEVLKPALSPATVSQI